MDRTRFIEHRGTRILLLDYTDVRDPDEAVAAIRKSMEVVAREPPASLRILTDVSGARYNTRVVQALKELAAHNRPHVRASAITGMGGLHRIAYQAVMAFSKRKIQVFDDRDSALDWLAAQD
jgi:hypothetical protein